MKIGKLVFIALVKDQPDFIGSNCALAGARRAQGLQQAGSPVLR